MRAMSALTLEAFLRESLRQRVARAPVAVLAALVERLSLAPRLVEGLVQFDPAGYQRRLICRTAVLDLLVLSWMPGQTSAIHDHARSRGVVRVHAGTLTSRAFTVRAQRARLEHEDHLPAGSVAPVEVGEVHQLANTSATGLVTIHAYAPPLVEMTTFEPALAAYT